MSLDQDVAQLKREVAWLRSRMAAPMAGEFLDSASSPGDDLKVRVFEWDGGEHAFGPVRWSPAGGVLPEAGDEAVIVERDDGVWQVVAWWSSSQDAGATQSAVDDVQAALSGVESQASALDSRLDALEATRTIRGIVSAAGAVVEGTGFAAAKTATGQYTVTFTVPFSDLPAVVVGAGRTAMAYETQLLSGGSALTTSQFIAQTIQISPVALTDGEFHFVAIGPA